jgi:hypothetical protein
MQKALLFMQKVKMMLLSLALFAVVGGALAFKAKFHSSFCTVAAYFDSNLPAPYYCSFDTGGGVITTTQCANQVINSTTNPTGTPKKVCTTVTNGNPNSPCDPLNCNILTSIKPD